MSEYHKCTTKITNEEILIQTLREMYGKDAVEVHETPTYLYGYQGDRRPEKAHIIVRRKHIERWANDIGFVRPAAGQPFEAIISAYDIGQGQRDRINQNYSANYVHSRLVGNRRMRNIRKERTKNERGQVVIRVRANVD